VPRTGTAAYANFVTSQFWDSFLETIPKRLLLEFRDFGEIGNSTKGVVSHGKEAKNAAT
jgi:hypothetical protein